jgi:hypothetical protein
MGLEELQALGRRLSEQHREALEPVERMKGLGQPYRMKDRARALKLTAYRNLVAARIMELDPPYAWIKTYPGGRVEVTLLRPPKSEQEEEDLAAEVDRLRAAGSEVTENRDIVAVGV